MPFWARGRSLIRNVFTRHRVERALDAELQGILDILTEEKIAAGLSPEEARRAARVEFGGVEQLKEQVREVRAGAVLEALGQDVRYALRTLRRAPGFTVITVLTLALGIGANTAIFSIVDALLFRPLPIASPDRVFALYRGATGSNASFSLPDFLDYRAEARYVDDIAAWGGGNRLWFRFRGNLERVSSQMVSGNYFDVLGVRPAAGRLFTDADDEVSALGQSVVISDRFWRTTFDASPSVIGQPIDLGGQLFTVIGVAAAGFNGLAIDEPPDVWLPFAAVTLLDPGWNIRTRQEIWISIVARVRADADTRQAEASLQPIAARIATEVHEDGATGVRLVPASAAVSDPAARASSARSASILMGVVGFVLLIACANVANMVLARSEARRRELGVRLAIGATRGRIVRQVLTENLLLALASGAAGLLVAQWTTSVLVALAPATAIPRGIELALDGRVLAFALLLSTATGVVFGAGPAWQLGSLDALAVTKGSDRLWSSGRDGLVLRRLMVVAQVALSLVLLVSASLFIRTLSAARAVASGYDPGKVLLVALDLSVAKAPAAASLRMSRQVLERVTAIPGVESASLGQIVPFSGSLIQRRVVLEGGAASDPDVVPYTVVAENYFATVGLALRGRDFRATDDERAPRVVVINETLARRLWPGQNAIGKRLQLPLKQPGPAYEVIGVASNGKYVTPTEAQQPFLYLPLAQNFRPRLTLHVRTSAAPAALVAPVREAVRGVSPDLPAYNPISLEAQLARSLTRERMIARLLTVFGGLAILVAAIGIYGTLAYAVSRRTREMGVRLALGAASSDLLWMVVRQSAGLVALGASLGIAAALVLTRFVRTWLFGVTPTDPVAFGWAIAVLSLVALVATAVPARRAARVDPLTALRTD